MSYRRDIHTQISRGIDFHHRHMLTAPKLIRPGAYAFADATSEHSPNTCRLVSLHFISSKPHSLPSLQLGGMCWCPQKHPFESPAIKIMQHRAAAVVACSLAQFVICAVQSGDERSLFVAHPPPHFCKNDPPCRAGTPPCRAGTTDPDAFDTIQRALHRVSNVIINAPGASRKQSRHTHGSHDLNSY